MFARPARRLGRLPGVRPELAAGSSPARPARPLGRGVQPGTTTWCSGRSHGPCRPTSWKVGKGRPSPSRCSPTTASLNLSDGRRYCPTYEALRRIRVRLRRPRSMERTPLPPAAEALFRAHHDRSTGWLTPGLRWTWRPSSHLQHGDLVGARLGLGHQTGAQALPRRRMSWCRRPSTSSGSRGELGDAARLCEAARCRSHRPLRPPRPGLRSARVSQLAEEASFMPALVEVTFPRVRGARAVRAAFEPLPPVPAGSGSAAAARGRRAVPRRTRGARLPHLARRVPPARHGGSGTVGAPPGAGARRAGGDSRRRGLGAARRRRAREAARRSEEDARREAARVALESARAAEEQRQAELRRRADAARRALEAARAAEDAWRRAQEGTQPDPALADTLSSRVPVTDPEFPAPAEPPPRIEGRRRDLPPIPSSPSSPARPRRAFRFPSPRRCRARPPPSMKTSRSRCRA